MNQTMLQRYPTPWIFTTMLLVAVSLMAVPLMAEKPYEFREARLDDGTVLEYAIVLPEDFQPEKAYPAVLALPPGAQNRDMASAALYPWAAEARRRGWIGISPVAPGRLFHQGAEKHIPELLAHLRKELEFEHDALHLLGISNGGLSAFRVAVLDPEQYLSITVAPGYPMKADQGKLGAIAKMPVTLIVGSEDRGFLAGSRDVKKRLEALGATVELDVLPDKGHFIFQGLPAARLFEIFERARQAATEPAP